MKYYGVDYMAREASPEINFKYFQITLFADLTTNYLPSRAVEASAHSSSLRKDPYSPMPLFHSWKVHTGHM
jgi:hypothetical protein